ncbi:MAG: hypothetical protein V3V63_04245 [Candidatus Hydrothermarchaeaceae archaeon]
MEVDAEDINSSKIIRGLIQKGKITLDDLIMEIQEQVKASGIKTPSQGEILKSLKLTRKEIFRKHFE